MSQYGVNICRTHSGEEEGVTIKEEGTKSTISQFLNVDDGDALTFVQHHHSLSVPYEDQEGGWIWFLWPEQRYTLMFAQLKVRVFFLDIYSLGTTEPTLS